MSRTKKYMKRTITDAQVEAKIQEQGGELPIDTSPESLLEYAQQNGSLPRYMTEERLNKFFEAVALGASYDTASKYSGMTVHALHKWLNKAKVDIMGDVPNSPYVAFQQRLNKVEADYEINLLKDINDMIKERDPFIGHMIKFLSIKFPKKWGNTV